MAIPISREWSWKNIISHFGIMTILGLIVALIVSVMHPEAWVDGPLAPSHGTRTYMIVGSWVVILLGPVIAMLRHWKTIEFYVGLTMACAVLFGNLGTSFGVSWVSMALYFVMQRAWMVMRYYWSL